jgi:hypothetical protein
MDYIKVLTVLIAAIVAYIAYQQSLTARAKLRLDLYNKRFDVFRNCLKLTHAFYDLKADEKVNEDFDKAYRDFVISFYESKFLFDKNIYDTLKKIEEDLRNRSEYWKNKSAMDYAIRPLTIHMEKDETRQANIRENLLSLEDKMEKYMNFHTLDGLGNMDWLKNLFCFKKNKNYTRNRIRSGKKL